MPTSQNGLPTINQSSYTGSVTAHILSIHPKTCNCSYCVLGFQTTRDLQLNTELLLVLYIIATHGITEMTHS